MNASRILLATDFDSVSDAAVEATARLAVALGARVELLYVLEALMYTAPGMAALAERDPGVHPEASRKVALAVEHLRSRGVAAVGGAIDYGIAQDVIARRAVAADFDLLVIGTHGRGTTVRDIIQKSAIPVMAVPADASLAARAEGAVAPFRSILVPTDFAESAEHALEVAVQLAARFEATLTLVHSERLPATSKRGSSPELERDARAALDAAVARAAAGGLKVDAVLTAGPHWERIIEVAKQRGTDLIVMGTHGRAPLARVLLGSVAERVVNMSSVPVLTVSAPG